MKNRIAKILRIIAYIILLGGVILVIWGISDLGWYLGQFLGGIGTLISSIFVRGFAEVIELLQAIKDNKAK